MNSYAAVVITTATGGTNICSSSAVGGSAPSFTSLGNILVTESTSADFSGPGIDVLVLNVPSGWQFNAGATPTISYITGANITAAPVFTLTATSITIDISTNGTNAYDRFTISGLQVQATSTASSAGYIYASSFSGISGLTAGITGSNFGNLSLTSPVTPSVSISATPSGSLCPNTNAVFLPTPINGGATPSYQWYVNGASMATGATYSSNTLTNGNTVYCAMTASGNCLTTTSAISNTYSVTVTTGPLPVNGPTVTCPGTTMSLSDNTTGGTWSSSNSGIVSVDGSGNVSGVAVGTATVSYTASDGCASVVTITVNNPPFAPVLTTTVSTMCSGNVAAITALGTPSPTVVLSQNFNSGLAPWTVDSSGSIGTVPGAAWKDCGDGYINEQGLYHSPDNSAFAMSNSDTSTSSSYTSSKLISPVFSLAGYAGATLSFQQTYEYWPAGDSLVSVQISTDGGSTWATLHNYIGANVGNRTSFVTETFSLNGYLGQTNLRLRFYYYCHWGYYWALDNILVTGTSSIVTPVWSPSTYLFVDSACTVPYVFDSAYSTVYIHPASISLMGSVTYSATAVTAGCSSSATSTLNFIPSPSPITGTKILCAGTTTSLSDVTSGGTWTSGNVGIATIGVSTGVVTGVTTGTVIITYMIASGCTATTVVTVNSLPATINGPRGACIGTATTLSDTTSGGVWTSGNGSVATIGSASGVISTVATGTANITYSLGTGCNAIATITVNPLPGSIIGPASLCAGATVSLTDINAGGTWASSATFIAVAGSSTGTITGISAGTTTITYTLGTGCIVTSQVTVNPIAPITGVTNVCVGSSVTLSDGISGGTWGSSSTVIATAGAATGIVTGTGSGIAIISYILPTGCTTTAIFTVNPLPATITGVASVCVGSGTALTDATSGGVWSSGLTSIATVGSTTGNVHGVSTGTTAIRYALPTGCYISQLVTVNPLPQAITGSTVVCAGASTTLTDASTGGTWASGATSIAAAGSSSGIITGVSGGTANITYALPTGCIATTLFSVNPLPTAVNGSSQICLGLTTTLTDATSGGTWSSSNISVATIGTSTGLVNALSQGTSTITYTLATGCLITSIITINALPANINGVTAVCNAASITLSDASTGGVWSSGASGVAIIGATTGVVTGEAAGTAIITYTLPTGCITTKILTVNPLPSSINGIAAVCQGFTTSLTDGTATGVWSSGNVSVGSVGSSTGIVTGTGAGTTSVTYMLGTGCTATATVTVSALPAAISGSSTFCQGASISLTDAVTGGTWLSSNTSNAIIGATTGSLTGLSAGTTTITYTTTIPGTSVGCSITAPVTINPLPSGITGSSSVCTGLSINLTDGTAGGNWSSSNAIIATVGTSGLVYGVLSGVATITYSLPTGCGATKTVVVNQLPGPITGPGAICQGAVTTLSDLYTGGTWSSSNTGVATVGSASGSLIALSMGTTIVTYSLSGGCNAISTITVNLSPGSINGVAAICAGATTTLTDAITAGTWSSGNTTIANIGSSSGIVSGLTAGTANITYALSDGCVASAIAIINVMPTAINGPATVCSGSSINLSDNVTGGIWSSSNTGAIIVGSSSGVSTGTGSGTATITYGFPTGCMVTAAITTNPLPGFINGTSGVCLGFGTSLSDATMGGVWTSSNTSVATVGSGSGLVTTVSSGTTNVYYSLPTGCAAERTIVVNPQPSIIGGTTTICAGTVTILTDSISGGAWTSNNTAIATIGSGSGALTGVGSGSTTISYSLGAGCIATTLVTVHLLPSSISGSSTVCVGGTITLSDPIGGGGTWSSSLPPVATIGATTGVINGVSAGTATITYSLGVGCTLATIITVNPLPSAIFQASHLCYGAAITLSDSITGGSWISGNPSIATAASSTGIISGISTGTASISYILATGCQSSLILTVYTLPASLSGTPSVCAGLTATLSDASTGGTWSSASITIASIGSASGIVNGLTAGTTNITYTLPTGCFVSNVLVVNPLPSAVTGTTELCAGLSIGLSDTTVGGSWSSGTLATATVGASSGIVNGVAAGTAVITYTLPTGCISNAIVTIDPLPQVISGSTNVCIGGAISLSDLTAGGTWSSSNASVASVGYASGILSGIAIGTATVTYTLSTGCLTRVNVTVNALPPGIDGPEYVCVGNAITLTDSLTGGVWSDSSPFVSAINSTTGIVTGISNGTSVITYTSSVGCSTSYVVTTEPLPAAISGAKNVCIGSSTSLSNALAGGTWSSATPSIATIDAGSGVVTGVAQGTATITYTSSYGCLATATVTVNSLPLSVSGTATLCAGSFAGLSDASAGGSWSSNNTSIATVTSSSGFVYGVTAGSTYITYALPTGCITTALITINPLPSIIAGNENVCIGLTSLLSDTLTGGTWVSTNTSVAIISTTTGIVSGIATGTSAITYTLATGCSIVANITVDPLPSVITGNSTFCVGLNTVLSDATAGGTWSSGNLAVATALPASGVITGISAGTAVITYTLPTGCYSTAMVTVNTMAAISGTRFICSGTSATLSDASGTGTWSSSNATVAVIGSSSGIVTGNVSGTSTISFALSSGCITSAVVTVNSLPGAITGATNVCADLSTALSDPTSGGSWTSSNISIAIVGVSSGVLTGVSAGTAAVTYTFGGTGCGVATTITVNPLPSAVSGLANVCSGLQITLSDATAGGGWSSSNSIVATVGAGTGIVAGAAAGTAIITYSLATGCFEFQAITVNPLPALIAGVDAVCAGSMTALTDSIAGGTWSSAAPSIATIGATTGIVNALSAGMATITYTLPTGCINKSIITINPLPSVITGSAAVCTGSSIVLSDTAVGGTWSSGNSLVAIAGSVTGAITGINPGVAAVTYTLPTGCTANTNIIVNPLPGPITGGNSVCAGSTIMLADTSSGGSWSSDVSSGIASVNPFLGIVFGISAGTALVSYTISSGCMVTTAVTVDPVPPPITGALSTVGWANVCVGLTTTLSDAASGGTWSSSIPTIASIGTSGIVTGLTAGYAQITYTSGTGCIATLWAAVNALPAPIVGPSYVCVGANIALSDATSGGIWSSSSPAVATVGTSSGIVTGVSPGIVSLTYTLSTGCIETITMIVNPAPGAITGVAEVCAGSSVPLSDLTAGGTWVSGTTTISTVSITGLVTGISAGTAIISYQLPTGCYATDTIVVNPLPAAIAGAETVCTGATAALSDVSAGGSWSITVTGIASIGSSGIVTGVSAGTAYITYTLPTGCMTEMLENVFASPSPIIGMTAVCAGSTTALSCATASGTWSVSNAVVATVGTSSGIVTAHAAGTTSISYSLGTGCFSTMIVTVNPLPATISGTRTVCTGATTMLSDSVAGGSWAIGSGASGIAAVGAYTGVITAGTVGTTSVTYTLPTGCYTSAGVTINASPAAITGIANACAGSGTLLYDGTSGGSWSSSNIAVAAIGTPAGFIYGAAAGSALISYVLSSGCYAATTYTVNPLPTAVSGNKSVCQGSSSVLSDGLTGGTWSISTTAGASIGASSGIVSGFALGTAIVTYTLPTGCNATAEITVNPYPASIAGLNEICQGDSIYLSDVTVGGSWSSGAPAIATANPYTGSITGIAGGSATISYTINTGCSVIKTVTVNPIFPITGSTQICAGSPGDFSDLASGGTWSSNNPPVAIINPATGFAYAVASGVTVISYSLSSGCVVNTIITVNPLPASFYVTGGGSYCLGSSGAFIELNGSHPGITYSLYSGGSLITSQPGTGSAIYYGPYTGSGSYSVIAVNDGTGCTDTMTGSASISAATVLVPSVNISTTSGDTSCVGAEVTFTATPLNGGASPAYQWYVNGSSVTSSVNTYSFIPASGDVVSVRLTSSASCALPDTVSSAFTIVTVPAVLPSLSIMATPGDTLCAVADIATLIPIPVNGGPAPSYRWVKNGMTAYVGSTYTYAPVNGDNILCVLHSDYRCLITDTAYSSNNIDFTVVAQPDPEVSIVAQPGISIAPGENDTLIAHVANGNSTPMIIESYQWQVNSVAIPGAVTDTFISSAFLNNDTVSCIVTTRANSECGAVSASNRVIIKVTNSSVNSLTNGYSNIKLLPNPNAGDFTITGHLAEFEEGIVAMEITDMLGETVYQTTIDMADGKINARVELSSQIANGMYIVRLYTPKNVTNGAQPIVNKSLHFIITR